MHACGDNHDDNDDNDNHEANWYAVCAHSNLSSRLSVSKLCTSADAASRFMALDAPSQGPLQLLPNAKMDMSPSEKKHCVKKEKEPDLQGRDWSGPTTLTRDELDAYTRFTMSHQGPQPEQRHKALVDFGKGGENQPMKVGNTQEMKELWMQCQTLDEMKTASQARMTRIMTDCAISDKARVVMAAKLWSIMDMVDRKGIMLDGQIDPNNTTQIPDLCDEEPHAMCAACGHVAFVSDKTFWSEGAGHKLMNRLDSPANRVRSGLMCISCGAPKPKALVCSSCSRALEEKDFTKSQRSKKQMRCKVCVEQAAMPVDT
jgi:hypothetical protein